MLLLLLLTKPCFLFLLVWFCFVFFCFCVFLTIPRTANFPASSEAFFSLSSTKTPFFESFFLFFLPLVLFLIISSPPSFFHLFSFPSINFQTILHFCLSQSLFLLLPVACLFCASFFHNSFVKPSLFQTHLVFNFCYFIVFFLLCFFFCVV